MMEKSKYQEQIEKIESSIKLLNEEKKNLTNEYIESNKKFDIGEKVFVLNGKNEKQIGFVSRIFVGYKGDVEYKFFKCKKDGTPSAHELWMYSINGIEKFA